MFDLDKWQEIWETVKRHKLRTLLTAFGVFWGIFMLVVLLGAGNGLHNGVMQNFDIAKNAVFVWTRTTTIPYAGFQPGRNPQLTDDDYAALKSLKELKVIAPRVRVSSAFGGDQVSMEHNNKAVSYTLMGDYPEYLDIQPLWITEGRFINPIDIQQKRKVAVLGRRVKDDLFEEQPALGDFLKINGVPFQVIGIFDSKAKGEEGMNDIQRVHIPATTAQQTFNLGKDIGWFGFIPANGYTGAEVEEAVKDLFRKRHKIAPEDEAALGSANIEEEYKEMQGLFSGIAAFSWLVAIGTILAGMIGVGNIMLIIVKERTKEIGIRKSLGAPPASIIGMIVLEALVISGLSGYFGLLAGVGLIEGIAYAIDNFGLESEFFINPEIDFQVALSAILVLLVSGVVAGLIPGVKAARVNPVVALRDE